MARKIANLSAASHRSRSYARYSQMEMVTRSTTRHCGSPFRRLQQPVTSDLHGLITFAGGFSQTGHVCNFDLPPAVADDTGLLKRIGNDRDRVALHTDHLPGIPG